MKTKSVTFWTHAAMIAAIYVVLTFVFAPISFGEVQIRIAEMLTVLPIFTPAAYPGIICGMYHWEYFRWRVTARYCIWKSCYFNRSNGNLHA